MSASEPEPAVPRSRPLRESSGWISASIAIVADGLCQSPGFRCRAWRRVDSNRNENLVAPAVDLSVISANTGPWRLTVSSE